MKAHTIANLADYLAQLAAEVRAAAGHLHFAADAAEVVVAGIVQDTGHGLVVKAKSMTSEEVGLNTALAAAGGRAVETDLGEYILQLVGKHRVILWRRPSTKARTKAER